jgi:hypothetical protein
MKPGYDRCFARFYLAGHALTEPPFCSEGNLRGFGLLAVLPFERCLQRS